jgi:uncharacterized membrane protein HdeD (DUF308 family)
MHKYFCTFANKTDEIMKKYKDLLGIALVIIGVLVLVISFLTGLDNYNIILFSGLILIVGGIIMHIMTMKRESKY